MATANDMIRGALRKLGVRNAENPIQAFEIEDGLETLNDFLAEIEPLFNLGFKRVAVAADTIRVPDQAHDMIKANLAVRLAPDYEILITPELAKNASDSYDNLLITAQGDIEVKFPSTLPIGSGNCQNNYQYNRFFPPIEDDC